MLSTLRVNTPKLPSVFKGTILNSRVRLEKLARRTGWMQRAARKLDPIDFVHGIMLAVCKGEASMRLLASAVGMRLASPPGDEQTDDDKFETVSKQAFWERVDGEAVEFFRAILEELLRGSGFAASGREALPGVGRIIVEDSSKIDLPDHLADKFPASSNNKGHHGAGLRLQGAFDLISGDALRLGLTDYYRQDSTAAHDILPLLQSGDLVVRDLGYLLNKALNEITSIGAHFLSRHKTKRVLYHRHENGEAQIDLLKYLRDKAPRSGDTIDLNVVLGRVDDRKAPQVKCRIVAVRLPEKAVEKRLRKVHREEKRRGTQKSDEAKALLGWTILITSLERETASVEKLVQVYNLRWRVEIIFKSLKSYTPLGAIVRHRSNSDHICTLLHAWLCLVVVGAGTGAFGLMKGHCDKMKPNLVSLLKTMPRVFEILHMTLFISCTAHPYQLLTKVMAQSEYHDRYEARNKRRNMAEMAASALIATSKTS